MIKKLLLILLCLPLIGFGQTLILDANFEQALINLGYDTGTPNGSVPTANIDTVTYLNINNQSIADLTGIEDFTALTNLYCDNNQLTSFNVSNNTALTSLYCQGNQLTSLDVSNNTALTNLDCDFNQLTNLDVSQNTSLTYLDCTFNQLTSLDVRNGNNLNWFQDLSTMWYWFFCHSNANLTCIDVDDSNWSTANVFYIDPQHYFSNNCSGTAIEEHTTNKELLKVTDLLGREIKQINQPLFYIYNDGTVEKKIIIE